MKCPICTNNALFKFKSDFQKNIYQCESIKCHHLFTETHDQDLGICGEEDRGDLSIKKLKESRVVRIDTYNKRNKLMFKKMWEELALPTDAKVLDFGAGDGSLMVSLRECFPEAKITCIEPHDVFKEFLLEVSDNIVSYAEDLHEKFDLIILNEVVEHLNFPVKELRSLSKLLKKDSSAIYIATPLGETHLLSTNTDAYSTASHLHFFTRNSLNLCLNNSGLTSLDISDLNYPIYSTCLSNALKGKIKFTLIQFILKRLLKLSNRYCILPSGHISGFSYKK